MTTAASEEKLVAVGVVTHRRRYGVRDCQLAERLSCVKMPEPPFGLASARTR